MLYTLSPLSHNLGLGALVTALAAGGELVLHDLPRGTRLVDRLEETGAEFLFGVPTHAIDLLAELRARGARQLGKVRGFRVSGAAAPASGSSRELLRYGVVPQSGYGMTETCSHQYTRPDDPPERIAETAAAPATAMKSASGDQDDPDTEAMPGEIGEIGGRGASLMLGYFDDQAATEAAFNVTGWFMTGDLGWLDESGYLHITGRQEGRDHPRRPQHLPGADRGGGAALRRHRQGGGLCRCRPAARRAGVPGRGGERWDAVSIPRTLLRHLSAAGLPNGRFAGIHPARRRHAGDRQRQDRQARTGPPGCGRRAPADPGAGPRRVIPGCVIPATTV